MSLGTKRSWVRRAAVVAAATLALGSLSATGAEAHGGHHPGKPPKPPTKPVPVRLISVNDLHGNLQPRPGPPGGSAWTDRAPTRWTPVGPPTWPPT